MKILLNFRAFPMAMGRWYEFALKDLGHKVIVAGPSMGDEVPWPNGPHHFPKYNFQPDLLLPNVERFPLADVLSRLTGKPDLIIQAGDTHWLEGKAPDGIKNVIVATDPHAVDMTPRLEHATHFVSMQDSYGRPYNFKKYSWVPYGYYPPVHKRIPNVAKLYDAVFIGLHYPAREEYLSKMREKGFTVYDGLGQIYEEYKRIYNQGKIAFNFSSKLDVPARFWEGMAMGNLVLTNRVPELQRIADVYKIKEGEHYIGYDTIDEAIELSEYYLKNPMKLVEVAEAGYKAMANHDYLKRMTNMLWEIE